MLLLAAAAALHACHYATAGSPTARVPLLHEDFEAAGPAEYVVTGSGIGGSRGYRYPEQAATAGPLRLHMAIASDAAAEQFLTITGWFRRQIEAAGGEHQCIVSCPSRFYLFSHGGYQGRLGLFVHDNSGRRRNGVWSSWFGPFLANDEWVFFAVTCDLGQSKDNVAFYVGTADAEVVLDGRASLTGGAIEIAPADQLIVGASDLSGGQPFRGMLDNLRVYAVPMALTDIESIRLDDLRGEEGVRNLLLERPKGCFARKVPDPFSSSPATKPAAADTRDAGEAPRAGRSFSAVEVGTLQQVFSDRPILPTPTTGPTHTPRGAKACFQFAVSSAAAGPCRWRVAPIVALDGEQLRGRVKTYVLLPVHVEANNNGGARSGVGRPPPGTWRKFQTRVAPFDVAEVMLEGDSCELHAGQTAAVLVEVDIDPNATPGAYRGTLHFEQGPDTATVGFSLQVHKTTLPSEAALSTTYWLSPDPKDLTRRPPPPWWSEQHWQLIENSARTLRTFGQDSIRTPLIGGTEPLIRTSRDANGAYTFDFMRFDRWCETFLRLGFQRLEGEHIAGSHHLTMPPVGQSLYLWDPVTQKRSPLFTRKSALEEWYAFLPVFYDALYRHLTGKGWARHYIQCQMDEPHDLDNYRKLTAVARKHLPGIATQDAVNSSPDQYSPLIDNHVFALTSLAGHPELARQRRDEGKAVWLYHCCSPYPPYPNRHLDESLANSRLYPWLAFLLEADGYLFWAANMYRGADPYTSSIGPLPNGSQNPGHPPGDNWFFYPGQEGLLGSLRMVAFRDGLVDHALLTLLARRDRHRAQAIRSTIVRSVLDYETVPESYRRARQELLEALAAVDGSVD